MPPMESPSRLSGSRPNAPRRRAVRVSRIPPGAGFAVAHPVAGEVRADDPGPQPVGKPLREGAPVAVLANQAAQQHPGRRDPRPPPAGA
jgi:hypothetical protein